MAWGISYAELVVLVGTGIYVIGAKDLPRVSRNAGRATGKAVAYLATLKKAASAFAQETEVSKVHEELQLSLQHLRLIRNELRSGVNFTKSGPQTTWQIAETSFPSLKSREVTTSLVSSPEKQQHVSGTIHSTDSVLLAEASADSGSRRNKKSPKSFTTALWREDVMLSAGARTQR